jgi:hypothetical protein
MRARATGLVLLLAAAAGAALAADAPVYRCGSSYSSTPCPGGTAVDAGDARSAAQRAQAEAVKQREAALADQLAAERRERDRAAAGQVAAGIRPAAAAAPAHAASQPKGKGKKKTGTYKPKTTQPVKLGGAG